MSRGTDQPRLLADLPPQQDPVAPGPWSVSGLVAYARCPRQCYWSTIERRPRSASPAARIGSLIHGWIERQGAGQGCLAGMDGADGEPARMAVLKAAFLASPYGDLRPVAVERPFVLGTARVLVRGRVDALYERDGRLEIVDFKTGRGRAEDDGAAGFQLDVYALAAVDCWGRPADGVRTTEWHLGAGTGDSRDFDPPAVERVRARLGVALAGLADGRFDPVPGSYCRHCDFVGLCPAGRAAARRIL